VPISGFRLPATGSATCIVLLENEKLLNALLKAKIRILEQQVASAKGKKK
jgi:hypothetical protein